MGVMACDRPGCTNIMCHHCILESTKYICTECLHELEQWRKQWPGEMTARKVWDSIREFMDTRKGTYDVGRKLTGDQIEDEYDRAMGFGRHATEWE